MSAPWVPHQPDGAAEMDGVPQDDRVDGRVEARSAAGHRFGDEARRAMAKSIGFGPKAGRKVEAAAEGVATAPADYRSAPRARLPQPRPVRATGGQLSECLSMFPRQVQIAEIRKDDVLQALVPLEVYRVSSARVWHRVTRPRRQCRFPSIVVWRPSFASQAMKDRRGP